MPHSMRCSAVQPGGYPCKYLATIGDLCGVHHRQQQRQATVADAEPTPFQIHTIPGEPPPLPAGRWPESTQPAWSAYKSVMARSPGTWHVIETEDEVWAYKGCGILRGMGCEAVTRGSSIYARIGS